MTVQEQYEQHCFTPSDINEHLPTLLQYATACKHITEMGTRRAVSTYAFLMAKPEKLVCYDIARWEDIDQLEIDAAEFGVPLEFHQANVLDVDIEVTDFLFVDTFHSCEQLKKELQLHAGKVRKYLAFHDTTTFWEKSEDAYMDVHSGYNTGQGLKYALEPFLEQNTQWQVVFKTDANNGLTILQRVSA